MKSPPRMDQTESLQEPPGAFHLDPAAPEAIMRYLAARQWLAADERVVRAEPAGPSNMNCVVRVTTNRGSLILKQARPWVERYPDIPAPVERALVESQFYRLLASQPKLSAQMPRLLWADAAAKVLALEDLGHAEALSSLYAGGPLAAATLVELAGYLRTLHRDFRRADTPPLLSNRAMRRLNHEHIFRLPMQPGNGLDLDRFTPGLAALAAEFQGEAELQRRVARLGEQYLADGETLLHGDFYPGSWLQTAAGVRVIDPEFCFLGPAEFDVGVLLAHLHLLGQADRLEPCFWAAYEPAATFSRGLAGAFAGAEIMRRLLGVAQLPLSATRETKRRWLQASRQLLLVAEI